MKRKETTVKKSTAKTINRSNTLSVDEFVQKLEKQKIIAAERGEWVKVRSYQLKIDNACVTSTRRGNISALKESYSNDSVRPNRRARREGLLPKPIRADSKKK
jgi:hypothetical protein